MINRCENPKTESFGYCGARGITICRRWRESFAAFVEDVGLRPAVGLSLGRIDNDGHYEPGNVEWQTASVQARNTRRSIYLEIDGERLHLLEALARYGLPGLNPRTVANRIRQLGWGPVRALTTPARSIQISRVGSAGYHGVSRCRNRWRATVVTPDRVQHTVGSFKTPEKAADAYDRHALELIGPEAKLNRRALPAQGQSERASIE